MVVSKARLIQVKTEHGYGWSDNREKQEWDYAPDSFHASVDQREKEWFDKIVPVLEGKVLEDGHKYDGYFVMLSQRHEHWDGVVNVTLEADGRRLQGFGNIELASFND